MSAQRPTLCTKSTQRLCKPKRRWTGASLLSSTVPLLTPTLTQMVQSTTWATHLAEKELCTTSLACLQGKMAMTTHCRGQKCCAPSSLLTKPDPPITTALPIVRAGFPALFSKCAGCPVTLHLWHVGKRWWLVVHVSEEACVSPHPPSVGSITTDREKAMSENYVVIIEQSVKMDLIKIVTSKLRGKNISNGIYWDPNQETIFQLVNKHTGKVSPVKYHTKPLSTFHQINAFEEDGFLMVDLCCSDDGQAMNNYLIQNLRKSGEALDEVYNSLGKSFPRRFVLPLSITNETPLQQNLNTRPNSSATAICQSEERVFCTFEDLHGDDLVDYGGLEFPHIHYNRCNTKPYRYFYGCGFRHLVGDSLIKMDLENKKLKVWSQPGFYPSEPVFVPSPDAEEEDDGVILSVVLTPTEDQSTFLLVLDAKTFEELGRAEVPVKIPYGFHGVFNSA
ncbi:carotenoid-cleaving dioxygenase, mitochondrial isoform X3 [Salminus brasiliensis]|uniref:carotenoid-cleaving dioxygenase, mitochondrial isoform X3 n=1 Tax=Salminus brasiliensis TaxID=930266 RepID=UPI003B82D455